MFSIVFIWKITDDLNLGLAKNHKDNTNILWAPDLE